MENNQQQTQQTQNMGTELDALHSLEGDMLESGKNKEEYFENFPLGTDDEDPNQSQQQPNQQPTQQPTQQTQVDNQTNEPSNDQQTQQQTQTQTQDQQEEVVDVSTLLSETERAKDRLRYYEQFDGVIDQLRQNPALFQQLAGSQYQIPHAPGVQQPYPAQYPGQPQATQYPGQPQVTQYPNQPQVSPYPSQPAPLNLPKPPEDFDPYEMTNPSTPSGKYFMGSLNQAMNQQVGQIQEQMQQGYQAQLEQLQQMQLQMLNQQMEQQQYNNFMQSHRDVEPGMAQGFWNWVNNPSNVTMDTLFEVYRILNQPNNQQSNTQQTTQPVNSQRLEDVINKLKQNQQIPNLGGNVGGPGEQDVDMGKKFAQDLGKGWVY